MLSPLQSPVCVSKAEAEIIWHVRWLALDDHSEAASVDSLDGNDPEGDGGGDTAPDSDDAESGEPACRIQASALGCDTWQWGCEK